MPHDSIIHFPPATSTMFGRLSLLACRSNASRTLHCIGGLYLLRKSLSVSSQSPAASSLTFIAEATYFPEKEKVAKGSIGEDGHFMTSTAIGVADGVGGYAEQGIDSGIYARGLMTGVKDFYEARRGSIVEPLTALEHSFHNNSAAGASTACIASVDGAKSLRVLNVGDSGLMVWRYARPTSLGPPTPLSLSEAAKLWELAFATEPQTHAFNTPRQLEAARGRGKAYGLDQPSDGFKATINVSPGNLGMFDIRYVYLWSQRPCSHSFSMRNSRYPGGTCAFIFAPFPVPILPYPALQ